MVTAVRDVLAKLFHPYLARLKSGRIRCAIRAIFDFHVLQARAVL